MEQILLFIPEMITLVLAFGACAVVHGVMKNKVDTLLKEVTMLRAWKDEHTKEGTELKSDVAEIKTDVKHLLRYAGMNGKHKDN